MPTLLLLLACRPGGLDADKADDTGDDDLPAWADPDGARLAFRPDGSLTWTDARGVSRVVTVAFGTTAGADASVNYDPWFLYDDAFGGLPTDLAWRAPVAAEVDDDGAWLTLDDDTRARLSVDAAGPGLRLHLAQADDAPWAPYARVTVSVEPDEAFYGLGEVFGHVQHRGTVVPMQFEPDLSLESGYNETHVPVPLLVSSASWGLLVDSYRPGTFDVAAVDTARVTATFNQVGSEGEVGAGLELDLYAPPSPAGVTARYHARTGPPEIPPDWAFAPLQWRNEVASSADVRADMEAIRSLGIPTGTIWVDNPWQTTYNSMQPDPARFPDWADLVDELHDGGFKVMAWSTPYVEPADPDHATFEASGWFVDATLLFSDFGDWVDLTEPDAMGAWQRRVYGAALVGIEGWKLDYGEDAQLGLGAARLPYLFANGEDERTMHHQYAIYYHRAYAEPYEDGAGFVLGRAGVLGGHAVTDCIWPGDLDSGFERYGVDGYVGGLPSAIRAGTGLSVSGYPFFASDTGGYRNGRPTHEAMVRWTEYSALLPIMQYGGGGANHNPWDFTAYGDSQFDEDTVEAFRRYAVLHTRLFPYFKLLSERVFEEGLPVVLPQGLAYPDAGEHPDDTFLVGDDLFVAPVEEEGATSRTLTLPPGDWVHWWTGERLEGDRGAITVDAPLGAGPLYQRAGSVIPLLRRTVMTLSPAGSGVDTFYQASGPLNARVVPGGGATVEIETGERIDADSAAAVTLTAGANYSGWDVEVWAPGATSVEVGGAALAQGDEDCTRCWIPGDPWVRVILPGGDAAVAVR